MKMWVSIVILTLVLCLGLVAHATQNFLIVVQYPFEGWTASTYDTVVAVAYDGVTGERLSYAVQPEPSTPVLPGEGMETAIRFGWSLDWTRHPLAGNWAIEDVAYNGENWLLLYRFESGSGDGYGWFVQCVNSRGEKVGDMDPVLKNQYGFTQLVERIIEVDAFPSP